MIRNAVLMLVGFIVGFLALFVYGMVAEKNERRCISLLDELYVNKPHDGKLTEWIYEVKRQDSKDIESVALEVRELAYIFSVAYAGILCSDQEGFVQKLNDIKRVFIVGK